MDDRGLELSDFVSVHEADIRENPYRFLNLPEGADLRSVRNRYISLSKIYFPDMVNPRLSNDFLNGVTPDDLTRIDPC